MAKQANRKLIGAFVLIAVAIMAASVVIFGSGEFFKKTDAYVLYFEGTVKGLNIGAPVLFRGVQVGQVTRIVIRSYLKEYRASIPVFIEVYPERFEFIADGVEIRDMGERMPKFIERGLRAQLVTQSMITGQLGIQIDLYPGTPVVLRKVDLDEEYIEIPTIPSALARLGKALEKVDLKEIEARLSSILASVDRLLKNPDLEASIHELKGGLEEARHLLQNANAKVDTLTENLNRTIDDAGELIRNVDGQVKNLSVSTKATLREAQKTLKSASKDLHAVSDDAQKILKNLDRQVQPLSSKAQGTLDQAETTLAALNSFVGEGSDTRHKLNRALDAIAAAAQSADSLMDYLERHPEALLQGKGGR